MNAITTIHNTLRDAAAQNDAPTVLQLIQAGAPIDEFDGAPLRAALRHKHPNIVQILVEAGADCQSYLDEFMRIAAARGDAVSLQLLITHIKQPPFKPDNLNTYLALAIDSGDAKSVQVLIDAGADPKPDDQEPAKMAASVGSVEILRLLQQNGADLCADNSEPMRNAISGEHVEAVKFFIATDANFNAKSADFLLLAMETGDAEIVEVLLKAGAKLGQPSQITKAVFKSSTSMLMLMKSYNHEIQPFADDLVWCALDHGSVKTLEHVLNNYTVSQKTLDDGLEFAARDPFYPIFELLIKYRADASANHSAALKSVIVDGEFNVARLLLTAGAQISDLDSHSVVHVLYRDDRGFLITLLQLGVTVADVKLNEAEAEKFFIFISPNILLRDGAGNFFPKHIRDERVRFVLITAEMMKASPNSANLSYGKAAKLALWISELFQEMQLSS